MKILEWLTSFIAGVQIVASPLFIGVIAGLIIYGIYPTTTGLIFGVVVATLGLIVGVIFATKIWQKRGAIHFVSRLSASPELDKSEDEKK